MHSPVKYNFGSYISEDTVESRVFTVVRVDEGVIVEDPLVDSTVRFTMKGADGTIIHHFTSELVVEPNTIETPEFYAPPKGCYEYDIEVVFSDGVRRTINRGTLVSSKGVTQEDGL